MYPKSTEYMSSWNGRISLPQGWASRHFPQKLSEQMCDELNFNAKGRGRLGREVVATVQSSQRAADAVDKMIDAINGGHIPFQRIDFATAQPRSSGSQLAEPFAPYATQPSCYTSRFKGQKSRVRKIIDEFLEVAKKRGLYSRSPPSEQDVDDRFMRSRPTSSSSYHKQQQQLRPTRQWLPSPVPMRPYDTQFSDFSPRFDGVDYGKDTIFHSSSSPDLFEFDDRLGANSTFFDQSKDERWCEPHKFNSQMPRTYARSTLEPDDVPRHLDFRWWSGPRSRLRAGLQSSTQPVSCKPPAVASIQRTSESVVHSPNDWRPLITNRFSNDLATAGSQRPASRKSSHYWTDKQSSGQPTMTSWDSAESKPLWIPTESTDGYRNPTRSWSKQEFDDPKQLSPNLPGFKSSDRFAEHNETRKPIIHCVCCRFNGSGPSQEPKCSESPSRPSRKQVDPMIRHDSRTTTTTNSRPTSSSLQSHGNKLFGYPSDERVTVVCPSNHYRPGVRYLAEQHATQRDRVAPQCIDTLRRRDHWDDELHSISPITKTNDKVGLSEFGPEEAHPTSWLSTERRRGGGHDEPVGSANELRVVNSTSERLPCQRVPLSSRNDSLTDHGTVPTEMRHESTERNPGGMITPLERPAMPTISSPPEPRGLVQSRNAKPTELRAFGCSSSDKYRSFNALATSTPCIPVTMAEANHTTIHSNSSTNEASGQERRDSKMKPSIGVDSAMRTPDWIDRNNTSVATSRLMSGAMKSVTLSNVRHYSVEE